jgi:DNA end-binding protein Ku
MPRPLWKGSISFGLVDIPVQLFRAQAPKEVRFHQLHKKDGVRIQQKRWCPADDEEVPYDEIVKGYELAPENYVLIEPEELGALDPKSTHVIEIQDFVDLDEIDPLFYDRGYHVAPGERATKSYGLLTRAMEDANKVGIARFVMRTKEYLCAIRPHDGGLVLETMLFADEVVSPAELGVMYEVVTPDERELKMARQLIDSLAADFDAAKYRDEYREKVLALIDAKAEGRGVVQQPEVEEKAPVVDLMAALEASLAAAREQQKARSDKPPSKKRAPA